MKSEIKVTGCKDWGCYCAKCQKMPLLKDSQLRNCLRCKDKACLKRCERPCTIETIDEWQEKEIRNTYHKPITHGKPPQKKVSEPKNLEFNW